MSEPRDPLERIAVALERLVKIEERKPGWGKALEIAARQELELRGVLGTPGPRIAR